MLQDAIHPSSSSSEQQHHLSIDGISSPIAAQILHFCDEDGDLFADPLRSSDVSSCSATGGVSNANTTTGSSSLCCYDEGTFASDFSPFHPMDVASLSALLDSQQPPDPEHDIVSAAAYASPHHQPPAMYPPYLGDHPDQLSQIMLTDAMAGGFSSYSPESMVPLPVGPLPQQQGLPPVYDEDCLPPLPVGYMDPPPSTSYSFLDPGGVGGFYAGGGMGVPLCGPGGEGSVGFFGGMMVGLEAGMGPPELLEYQRAGDGGGMGIYGPESIHRVYSSGDLQVIGDGQHLVGGCGASPTALPASDISALDESTFKVGRLSNEERKEKIHRYMKKRNERNFSKKIKYACRKTLADSRPRVRGRFAKNDEFGEAAARPSSTHHEYDEEEEVVVKEEEDMLDSSDILAHISGVNSFKYNYTLESWI